MSASTKKYFLVFFLFFALIYLNHACWNQTAWAQPVQPAWTDIKKIYQAGSGLPVGKIQSTWGDVAIIHRGAEDAYLARVGLPLFRGDTIITDQNASFSSQLKDGSTVILAGGSMLKINLSAHDSQRKSSVSSLSLTAGKAYFQIARLDDFEPREFKVETDLIIAGGRQADFTIFISEETTEIIAFKDSLLEVMNLNDPEQKIFLSEFQRAEIQGTDLPSTVEIFPEHEAKQLLGVFRQYSDSQLSNFGFSASGEKEAIGDEDLQENAAGRGASLGEFP